MSESSPGALRLERTLHCFESQQREKRSAFSLFRFASFSAIAEPKDGIHRLSCVMGHDGFIPLATRERHSSGFLGWYPLSSKQEIVCDRSPCKAKRAFLAQMPNEDRQTRRREHKQEICPEKAGLLLVLEIALVAVNNQIERAHIHHVYMGATLQSSTPGALNARKLISVLISMLFATF